MSNTIVVAGVALLGLAAGLFLFKKREQIIQFTVNKFHSERILMIGDSHTANGKWNFWLGRYDVMTIAKGGYTSRQVLNLLKNEVRYGAKHALVMIGTNDVSRKSPDFENYDSAYMHNCREISDVLEKRGIKPIFQSVFHRHGQIETNERVNKMNSLLMDFCAANNYTFLDLRPHLSKNQDMRPDVHRDGVHLNSKGYRIWVNAIRKEVANL